MDDLLNCDRQKSAGGLGVAFVRRTQPQPSAVFDSYWQFAAERQRIYRKRVAGHPPPWTGDRILAEFRFTNPYRAADRVSQYLIRNVIYGARFEWEDELLRTLLFKLFNKIETWQLLESSFGEITTKSFSVGHFARLLQTVRDGGASIYSAAYIMPSGPAGVRRPSKHQMHLELLERELKDGLAIDLANAKSMEAGYQRLLQIPGFGRFLAYQFITDLNYGPTLSFSEMEFVIPGPGARDGIRKCFISLGGYSESEIIAWVAERQASEFARLGLDFQDLWGRPLQLIDCQNLFCEVDKYARVAHPGFRGHSGRTRIKQRFAQSRKAIEQPFFPPKWGIEPAPTFTPARPRDPVAQGAPANLFEV
ncbi:nucleotide kinase domain-containing protein [Ramlibacter sp.]|uniref:nucleotide kinase domain-containing protein n=1 Tax=Ramlibacter sp. TaxID=1917967 RepID=UPI0039C9C16E